MINLLKWQQTKFQQFETVYEIQLGDCRTERPGSNRVSILFFRVRDPKNGTAVHKELFPNSTLIIRIFMSCQE